MRCSWAGWGGPPVRFRRVSIGLGLAPALNRVCYRTEIQIHQQLSYRSRMQVSYRVRIMQYGAHRCSRSAGDGASPASSGPSPLDFSLHRPTIICNQSGTLAAFSVPIANTPLLTVRQKRRRTLCVYGTDHLADGSQKSIRTVYSCIHVLSD